MTNWRKIGIAVFLLICTSAIGYLMGQLLLGCTPPANPAADRIAFSAASYSRFVGFVGYDIYVTNVDSAGLTRITKQAGSNSWPTWSPRGDEIAYYGADGLYTMNTDGSGQPELLWYGTAIDPAWSPDGSKIAFADHKSIHVLDLETRHMSQLMDGSIPSSEPAWSPDGTRIAFTFSPYLAMGGEPDSSIAVMSVDGSGFVQLTPDNNSGSPEWSPDGSQIVFQRNGNIYVMNADGTNVRALTQDGESYSPTWSPDGIRIAFVSSANRKCGKAFLDGYAFCTSELRIMDAEGSNAVVIRSEENENIVDPAWAPRN